MVVTRSFQPYSDIAKTTRVPVTFIPDSVAARGTRERILFAAASAFCANGFKSSTIREIAVTAGLNEGTVFRYFPQKQHLYWPAIDWYFRTSGLAEVFRQKLCQNGVPKEVLVQFSRELARTIEQNPGILRLLSFAVLELEAETRSLCAVHLRPLWNAFSTRIKVWIETGELPAIDPGLLALTMVAGIVPQNVLPDLFGADSSECSQIIDFLVSRNTHASAAAKCTPEGPASF